MIYFIKKIDKSGPRYVTGSQKFPRHFVKFTDRLYGVLSEE